MNEKRWKIAQDYEKDWWQTRSESVSFEFYKKFAEELVLLTRKTFEINKDTFILEIGSGAGGILTYLNHSNNRFAIDPLENFYSSVSNFVSQRDESVKYYSAKGESIPFENNMFDLIIMDNVLDHCDDPNKVVDETFRVLKKGGFIYFKQNTYHFWGKLFRLIMEKFTIDKGHPYTFSKNDLKYLVGSKQLTVIEYVREGYFATWKNEIRTFSIKNIIKALLFVTRDKVTYLLQKD